MDISKMLKRVTGDLKYALITVVIGVSILFNVISFFQRFAYGVGLIYVISVILSVASAAALLLYALNSHGIKGSSQMMLYAHFVLSLACTFMSFINNRLMGMDVITSNMAWASLLFPVAMLACIFFKMRGTPVLVFTVLAMVFQVFPVIRMLSANGFIGLLPVISLLLPAAMIAIAGYLVSTSK